MGAPVSYGNVLDKPERLGVTKNLTLFQQDLENETLPQWMFITPNMSKHRTPSETSIHPLTTQSL